MGGNKRHPIIENILIFSYHTKDCPYPPELKVWAKERELTIFTQMDGGYLGWTNLTGQFQHTSIDFSIIKYSLNVSGNGN